MYYGPHGPTGHGSGAPMIEAMTRSFMQILKKMQREKIKKIQISDEAVRDFNEHRELYLKRTTWAGTCSSWFTPWPGGEPLCCFGGLIGHCHHARRLMRETLWSSASPVMFPGNRVLIIELLTNPRWEDWNYSYGYAGNRFGYMGNGFTQREVDGRGESGVMTDGKIGKYKG